MIRRGVLGIGLGVLTSLGVGCTHQRILSHATPGASYEVVNELIAGRDAEILLTDGYLLRWRNVRLSPEVTAGMPLGGLPPLSGQAIRPEFETSRIAVITLKSRSRGALEGLGFGVPAGVLMGLIPTEECCDGTSKGAYVASMAFGGALWGVMIGAIRASRTRIVFR